VTVGSINLLGIVRWATLDKGGAAIAGVQPLFDVSKKDWRELNARDFPTQGQVFWPLAREATENALVFFRAEDNSPGQKDEFKVAEPQLAIEIVDFRAVGGPAEVRALLTAGLRRPGLPGGRALLWCSPDILVGPVKLLRSPTGLVTFDAAHRDRIPSFPSGGVDLRTVADGRAQRMLLSSDVLPAPAGYVDWDDDRLILRRALTAAVERAKRGGADPGFTKRLIDEAADSIAQGGTGADLQLERYRLERARVLCADAAIVSAVAVDLGDVLLTHPAVGASLDQARTSLRGQLEVSLRAELEKDVAGTRAELRQLQSEVGRVRGELSTKTTELASAQQSVSEARALADERIAEAEAQLAARLTEAMNTPAALLAQVAVLRPFLPKPTEAARVRGSRRPSKAHLAWPRGASPLGDHVEFLRALNGAFKARGISPAAGRRLHAAIIAGLMPIVTGGSGLAAFAAYAHAACGGRIATLHVSPGFMRPTDLFGASADDATFDPHPGGLLRASEAATSIPSLSLIVCEGINRGPTESYLIPLLQLRAAGLDVTLPPGEEGEVQVLTQAAGLRLGGTTVEGPTSLPVSRDLWAHAVAIDVDLVTSPAQGAASEATEISLSSDLLACADVPADLVDELLEALPSARDSRGALERFGAALGRLESDRERVKAALIECVMLPAVVLAGDEERSESLRALQQLLGGTDEIGRDLADLERRLRRRLA